MVAGEPWEEPGLRAAFSVPRGVDDAVIFPDDAGSDDVLRSEGNRGG